MHFFPSIPALMYHHVNRHPEDSITISPENFEEQMRFLAGNGYTPLSLDEFFLEMRGLKRRIKKPVLITFDDGYLDTWVYAYPILKKYNMKAAVFVITDLIKRSKNPRPTLEDIWQGSVKESDLPRIAPHNEVKKAGIYAKEGLDDYATWEELAKMEDSGFIDVQSHSASHSAYFSDDNILSFNDGSYIKMGYSTGGDLRLGIPVYRVSPALVARRYFDDKYLRDFLAGFVGDNGGPDFFKINGWKKTLEAKVKEYLRSAGGSKGHFERTEDQAGRIKAELTLSKEVIEKELNKECAYICWPWGSSSALSKKLAREAGYKGAIGMKAGRNNIFTDPFDIRRMNPCRKDMDTFKRLLSKFS